MRDEKTSLHRSKDPSLPPWWRSRVRGNRKLVNQGGPMRMRQMVVLTLYLHVLAAASGCAGARWEIVRQAPSNPLAGATEFYVAPVQFEGITIQDKPEAEWLATRSAAQQASWANDKAEYTKLLLHQLSGKGIAMITKGRTYRPLEG